MNILNQAIRRIAVRKVDNLIVKSFVTATNQNSIPKHYVPDIPSVKKVFKTILLFPLYGLGAFVWFGMISLWSFNVSLITSIALSVIFFVLGSLRKSTFDRKSVPLHVIDRRYKEGYRVDGYIDIEDPEKIIFFTKFQVVLVYINSLIFSLALVVPLYFIHLIILFNQQPK